MSAPKARGRRGLEAWMLEIPREEEAESRTPGQVGEEAVAIGGA